MKIMQESPMAYDARTKAETVLNKFKEFLSDYNELTTMIGNYEASSQYDTNVDSRVRTILFTIEEECGDIYRHTNDFLY